MVRVRSAGSEQTDSQQVREAVTASVAAFYQELPFNCENTAEEMSRTIRQHNQIAAVYPPLDGVLRGARRGAVLDVGCGIGWFVNTVAYYYGLPAVGIDLAELALDQARAVTQQLGLKRRVRYACADLFEAFTEQPDHDERFAVVNSLGVLHHTHDCRAALVRIAQLVEPNGFLHVGLYHRYGRRPFLELFEPYRQAYRAAATEVERDTVEQQARQLYQELNPSVTDPTLLRSWCRDQVFHPYETQHTFEEVYGWLSACGFECLATSLNQYQAPADWRDLFQEEQKLYGLSYDRNVRERRYFPGFFVVLAKRRPDTGPRG